MSTSTELSPHERLWDPKANGRSFLLTFAALILIAVAIFLAGWVYSRPVFFYIDLIASCLSIFAATIKSFSESPPMACVMSSTVTAPYVTVRSG